MSELTQQVIRSSVSFLAILNPFALSLYLTGVMEDLGRRDFNLVLWRASLMSLAVFCVFALAGETFLITLLGVNPYALRMFGGVVFFVVAYGYVTRGYMAAEMLRGTLDELPSAIALPFMIGAGTLTESILIGKRHPPGIGLAVIVLDVLVCFLLVAGFKIVKDHVSRVRERVFNRYVNILARINGLLIGAISTDMIIDGSCQLWLSHVVE
jgi:multiple antibiotic resistance protein